MMTVTGRLVMVSSTVMAAKNSTLYIISSCLILLFCDFTYDLQLNLGSPSGPGKLILGIKTTASVESSTNRNVNPKVG